MKSVMQHQFSQIPRADIPRSSFKRTHGHKSTFNAGYLVPFFADEVLPGDSFNLRANIFARLNTPIFPLMDNAYLDTFYFFIPNRLLWDNWQRFNGEQRNPTDSTDFETPIVTVPAEGFTTHSIADYFGLPLGIGGLADIGAMWFRAYNLVYNEWFRDENLQDSVPVPTDDGPDPLSNYVLLRRGKRHDYFTSCLPWPQKGPGVELPLGGVAPIDYTNTSMRQLFIGGTGSLPSLPGNYMVPGVASPFPAPGTTAPAGLVFPTGQPTAAAGYAGYAAPINVNLDAATATGLTINTFRQAFQLQRLLERDARGGTRYTEILRAHFGVVSPDARLQRPEYLGGSSSPVIINPVAQTASTDTTSPQGNLAAYGIVSGRGGFSRAFVEHGIILGLLCVRADLTYQSGIDRKFTRRGRYDYYWPALAHLGEQAVLNKEIFAQGTTADDDVFGYQERFAEYRYFPSKITGKMRSSDPQSLDAWHLSQEFDGLPSLNEDFIQEAPPISRVVAVPSEPDFIFDSLIELTCARPMPVYGVPGLIDHF